MNYLTESQTTLSFHTFTPVETADPKVEDSIIGEFRAAPPARVAIVSRDVSEYGSKGFGIDYDRRLVGYLAQKYRVEGRWLGRRFQMILLRSESLKTKTAGAGSPFRVSSLQ